MTAENNLPERARIRIDSFQGVHKGDFVHSQPRLHLLATSHPHHQLLVQAHDPATAILLPLIRFQHRLI